MFNNFYHGTIRKMMVAFVSMFDNINITLDNGKNIRVPIHYANRSKFLEVLQQDSDKLQAVKNTTVPIMGYEMTSLALASERMTNVMNKITENIIKTDSKKYTYNRVPYDINFELYVATNRLEDSFKIVEQIIPFFTPELSMKVVDSNELNVKSNVTFTLNAVSFSVETEGSLDDRRIILWQLSFTAKTFLYQDIKSANLINNITINIDDFDSNRLTTITGDYINGNIEFTESGDY